MPTACDPWPLKRKPIFMAGSDLEHRRAPREPAAERDEEHMGPGPDPAGFLGLAVGDRDGGGGGVAVGLDVDEKFFLGNAKELGDLRNDPRVGLVRDDK